jgi:hypothetical protein
VGGRDLFLVKSFIEFPDDGSLPASGAEGFEVYKLELDLQCDQLIQWIKVDNLGDNVLFVDDSDSVSMAASYFANYLQKDLIYYTADYLNDMKIYNVKDESYSQHCPFKSWQR